MDTHKNFQTTADEEKDDVVADKWHPSPRLFSGLKNALAYDQGPLEEPTDFFSSYNGHKFHTSCRLADEQDADLDSRTFLGSGLHIVLAPSNKGKSTIMKRIVTHTGSKRLITMNEPTAPQESPEIIFQFVMRKETACVDSLKGMLYREPGNATAKGVSTGALDALSDWAQFAYQAYTGIYTAVNPLASDEVSLAQIGEYLLGNATSVIFFENDRIFVTSKMLPDRKPVDITHILGVDQSSDLNDGVPEETIKVYTDLTNVIKQSYGA